jgi:hypothetical protein
MNWFVFELQGSAALVSNYSNKADAWSKYYEILMYAAKSSVPLHGAMLVSADLSEIVYQMAERPAEEEE